MTQLHYIPPENILKTVLRETHVELESKKRVSQ
jgi:hypothetical protein